MVGCRQLTNWAVANWAGVKRNLSPKRATVASYGTIAQRSKAMLLAHILAKSGPPKPRRRGPKRGKNTHYLQPNPHQPNLLVSDSDARGATRSAVAERRGASRSLFGNLRVSEARFLCSLPSLSRPGSSNLTFFALSDAGAVLPASCLVLSFSVAFGAGLPAADPEASPPACFVLSSFSVSIGAGLPAADSPLSSSLLSPSATHKLGCSKLGWCETEVVPETGHRGELWDDRPAFKSHAFGASYGKAWTPKAAQKGAKKMKQQ